MNRKERRAAASQARQSDTMGKSFMLGGVPASVRNHPKYQEGFPPEYFAEIDKACRLIERWVAANPHAELRWLEWDGQRTFIAAGLDVAASYLADSDDAKRLLAWLDERAGHRLSLNQAGWAVRKLGMMPMPDGTIWKGEPS